MTSFPIHCSSTCSTALSARMLLKPVSLCGIANFSLGLVFYAWKCSFTFVVWSTIKKKSLPILGQCNEEFAADVNSTSCMS